MPDLLLELFSEEIPARMQARACADLQKLVTDALVERGFVYEGARGFATPRRLTLHIAGLPAKGQDVREEKKGPRVGAPEGAVQGFLKSAGLASLAEAKIESDPKKGEFYVAVIEKPGQPTLNVLADILPQIIKSFPWPKSMRWGEASRSSSSFRWVRPLRSIVATFGPETEDPEIVPFEVDGIKAGDITYGHRFMAPEPIRVKRLDDYVAKLEAAKVVVDPERRRDIIRSDARNLTFAQGLELIEDEALVEEVAGLVEWPVVLMGEFEESFLDVPGEAIRATIRANQKCFVLRDAKTGKLTNRFLATANVMASDGGATIIAGNGRVIRARLSDAKFFWETDKKIPLDERAKKLDSITFHAKLGTQGERVQRIAALAKELAPLVGADPALAERAAKLAKADLVTEMVGEFPELQGLMGRYYAALQSEHPSVAAAIEEHYKPQGPSDRVPSDPVSIAVALADKLDTLVGFWAIDEKPTGSKDPYALRRAALGIIRLILENGLSIEVSPILFNRIFEGQIEGTRSLWRSFLSKRRFGSGAGPSNQRVTVKNIKWMYSDLLIRNNIDPGQHDRDYQSRLASNLLFGTPHLKYEYDLNYDLIAFLQDRLKIYLIDKGAKYDVVDAAFSPGSSRVSSIYETDLDNFRDEIPFPEVPYGTKVVPIDIKDNFLMLIRRVEALGAFLETEDGKNLLAGFKRAANILRAEEKKDGKSFDGAVDRSLLSLPEEIQLFDILGKARAGAAEAVAREDFAAAMTALAAARPAVDAFFEKVTVNADQPAVRENRLRLLNELRAATLTVADFSKVGG